MNATYYMSSKRVNELMDRHGITPLRWEDIQEGVTYAVRPIKGFVKQILFGRTLTIRKIYTKTMQRPAGQKRYVAEAECGGILVIIEHPEILERVERFTPEQQEGIEAIMAAVAETASGDDSEPLTLFEVLTLEMDADDESFEKKSDRLKDLWETADETGRDLMNRVMYALCGWSFPTLMEKVGANDAE